MSAQVTQTIDNGDGTITVYGRQPGGNIAHVIVGRDKLEDGSVYTMLDLACTTIDVKARALAVQTTLDSEADPNG